jgi:methylenetetrahydrofolate dehydrogenase (NADP+)/methenyltetrahydrofolate cyclohydrolase
MKIIDGKQIAEVIKGEIRVEVAKYIDDYDVAPHLAAILIGDDAASDTYVSHKEKDCKSVGITSSIYRFSTDVSEEELLKTVDFINDDDDVHGLIVQLPLPKHINVDTIISHIDPKKDVDGFHPLNIGKMMLGHPAFLPATPAGIIELLKRYDIETSGKHCVILGRSNIVGTPLSVMLSRKSKHGNATVTLCHSKTQNIKEITLQADILVAAIGMPEFVTADMVKPGAVVIDVGIHRVPDASLQAGFRLIGDVNFAEVSTIASFITPVPGGVGPMTRIALLQNTLTAFKQIVRLSS